MAASIAHLAYSALDAAASFGGVINLIIGIVTGTVLAVAFIAFLLRKEARLFFNRRRPIKIFRASDFDIDAEVNLLHKSKLFNIENPTTDTRSASEIGKHSLVIVGYMPKMTGFVDILNAAKTAKVPIIIYTRVRMDEEDERLLKSYPWHSVCNFPLKLMNDIFTILSTFPKMN